MMMLKFQRWRWSASDDDDDVETSIDWITNRNSITRWKLLLNVLDFFGDLKIIARIYLIPKQIEYYHLQLKNIVKIINNLKSRIITNTWTVSWTFGQNVDVL